jgi:hypothetical protein
MSALNEVTISCPHCRRQYNMKIDPERLQRLKTRATCGRCGKTFDAASRIIAAQQQQHAPLPPPEEPKPKPPRVDVAPPSAGQLKPTMRSSGVTSPDLRDEMEELAREFAEAAARFTPVGIKRSSVGLGGSGSGSALGLEPSAPTKPASVEEPTNPGIKPASVSAPSSATTTPDLLAIDVPLADDAAAPADQFSLDAEPASEEEFAAAVPTLSRLPAVPRSWLDQSDPGLAALLSPPSSGASALEALLNESETIALPPPPAAS